MSCSPRLKIQATTLSKQKTKEKYDNQITYKPGWNSGNTHRTAKTWEQKTWGANTQLLGTKCAQRTQETLATDEQTNKQKKGFDSRVFYQMQHRCTQKKEATKTGSGKSENTRGGIPQTKTEKQNHDTKAFNCQMWPTSSFSLLPTAYRDNVC